MASERTIIDNSEDPCQESLPDLSTQNVHPKVTAKKTFFDLHPQRRSRSDGSRANNRHPRIQWSAGTTEIGSRHLTTNYSDFLTRDIMKPILQREEPTADPMSVNLTFRRDLPPVPDSWGPIDVQPTQPEEVRHLLEPCPMIERSEVPQEATKPKKKFLDKFRKRSKPSPDSVVKRISDQSQPEAMNPEEEFRLLNESYIRDGIIQPESLTKHEYSAAWKFSSTSLTESRENVTSGSGYEEAVDKNGKVLLKSSFDAKRDSSDSKSAENGNSEESRSILPARRSCEPVKVKDLRKLRDSDPQPGPSGVNQDLHQNRDIDDSKLSIFETGVPKTPIDDPRFDINELEMTNLKPEESLQDMTNNKDGNVDIFKIDNPFSDFSLQTIKPKNLPIKRTELKMTKMPQHLAEDFSMPGTSKDIYTTDKIRAKVSAVENHGRKTRDESELRPTLSGLKNSSFLDEAKSAQRSLDATVKKVVTKSKKKVKKNQIGINAIAQQIATINVEMSHIFLVTEDVDDDDRKIIFNHYNRNFQNMLTLLMENIVSPTFNLILEKEFSNLLPIGGPFYEVTAVGRNHVIDDIIKIFQNACPKAINDVLNVSDPLKLNIDSVDNGNGKYVSLTSHHDSNESIFYSLALSNSVQGHEIIENIIDRVVNVAFSQHLIPEILFLSLSPTLTVTPNRRNFEGWCSEPKFNSRQNVHRAFSVDLLNFLRDFFNTCSIFDRTENFKILPAVISDNVARSLRLTHIWKNDE